MDSKKYNTIMNSSILFNILTIGVGVLLLLIGEEKLSFESILLILGATITLSVIKYISTVGKNNIFKVCVITGAASTVLGLFTMFNDLDALKYMGIFAGSWFIIRSISNGYLSCVLIKNKDDAFPIISLTTLIILVAGVLVMINPFKVFVTNIRLVSLFVISVGAFEFIIQLLLTNKKERLLKYFK